MILTFVDLVAVRPLVGDYGRVAPGKRFRTDSRTAERLESRGLAYRYIEPKAVLWTPENKMLAAAENKSAAKSRKI